MTLRVIIMIDLVIIHTQINVFSLVENIKIVLMIWNVKIARDLYWNIDEETIKLD